jgi:hypothetical protein
MVSRYRRLLSVCRYRPCRHEHVATDRSTAHAFLFGPRTAGKRMLRSLGDDSARRCAHETTEADVVPAFRRVIRQPFNPISDSWPSTHRQPYPGADLRARYRPSSSRRGRAGFINPSSARVNGSLIRLRQRETTWACLNLCLSIAGITGLMTCLSRPLYALIATSSECFHPSDLAETQAGIKGLCLVCVSGSDQSLLHHTSALTPCAPPPPAFSSPSLPSRSSCRRTILRRTLLARRSSPTLSTKPCPTLLMVECM